ncbi:hypothetical protein CDD81_1369 [Ophiocordyceps australis]|uniref:Mediator of RNA polymerase II transcription subunit 19 n=1 Tax=Ophiocordyceps australis TaxID=1399860 RepID=A0A2C5XFF2_9HYPO|nr:hypothetical protein CDD81_1369 [Ophiocordyceps australis]
MSFHPQTPQSPCNHSLPALSDQMASSLSASSAPAGLTTLPTPAHSVNGSGSHGDAHAMDDSPHKRKRPLDDAGNAPNPKRSHLSDRTLGIQYLHLDVGPKYLLSQTPYTLQHPPLCEDLYQLFDLGGIAAEVAREKPNGEKNALRKTYKGHIKRLGVTGHFDVQKKKEDAPSEFREMIQVPDLEWNVHQVKGREIANGLSELSLSSLSRAVTMAKGSIPKTVWDTSVLGDLTPSAGDVSKPLSNRPSAPNTPLASTPNASGRSKSAAPPPAQDPNRPRRNIKKRTYGESSYEGYAEGYPDDDANADTGYSTGEGDNAQKRRKRSPENSPNFSTMRQQSYGPGMVGA